MKYLPKDDFEKWRKTFRDALIESFIINGFSEIESIVGDIIFSVTSTLDTINKPKRKSKKAKQNVQPLSK